MHLPEKELTNEKLSKQFKDNFQLAITAIRLAQSEVAGGHEASMLKVMEELKSHPEKYLKEHPQTYIG